MRLWEARRRAIVLVVAGATVGILAATSAAQPQPGSMMPSHARFGTPVAPVVNEGNAGPAGSAAASGGRAPFALPEPESVDRPLPINLATALALGHARALDIAIATARVRVAAAQLKQANVLWLPSILLGGQYFYHDGRNQDQTHLSVFNNSRNTVMLGGMPMILFGVSDAIFQPLLARQEVQVREANLRTANNDTFQSVAVAYFNVQQARGEMMATVDAARRARDLVKAAEELAPGLVAALEINRARAEAARQQQLVQSAAERWRLASIELMRVLHLGAAETVHPLEPPQLQVTLVWPHLTLDELMPIALRSRPELASQQALVEAAVQRWRQERMRPLLPTVALRGASTSPGVAGTLGMGFYGAGNNGAVGSFGSRMDLDLQVLWQLDNLGFGYAAKVAQRRNEQDAAELELVRLHDRVLAEVASAQTQLRSAQARVGFTERELRQAYESAEKNLLAMREPKRAGNQLILLVRPQEVLVSVQALQRAYLDYYTSVADYNRAQFRLYRAMGNPANHPFLGPDQENACTPPAAGPAGAPPQPPARNTSPP